jgi:hypothetical protein
VVQNQGKKLEEKVDKALSEAQRNGRPPSDVHGNAATGNHNNKKEKTIEYHRMCSK